ncbi:QacE family quaternary ammonium compound efflux SMR transporter [Paenibacillus tyrfis]|uniref:DMT family transporter n=1 Tax=Paenibacillus tyrfis TaxID=1501230 RepID=UPI0024934244|nr:multidrug efflux SMR transporter [Paenibacillus tyrfis]GLI06845.1 QacE family quaternary ammonium compound efflux SMR transporter [Paenibacillus tyrfis]
MKWIYLSLAILFEVAGTTSMKFSQGLTKPVPSILMFVFYSLAFSILSLALKKLEVGTAYAIWSGVGTALIVSIGIMFFDEVFTIRKMMFIGLIIVGVIGLNMSGTAH